MITAAGEILYDKFPEYKKLGGAPFNFIYHIKKLTGNGSFISAVGDDEDGRAILDFLEKNDFNRKYIKVDSEHGTGIVDVKLDEDKIPDFNIVEDRAWDYIEVDADQQEDIISDTDLFYFGTLAQRNDVSRYTIQSFWEKDCEYFCDINLRQNYYTTELLRNCLVNSDVVKLNKDELELISEKILKKSLKFEENARELIELFEIKLLCVTLGSDGSMLFTESEKNYVQQEVKDVKDTVGAGDAFAAMLCIGYKNNWSVSEMNKRASAFAAEITKIEGALPENDAFYDLFRNYTG